MIRKSLVPSPPPPANEAGWAKLFNERDFARWKMIDKGVWSIENGGVVGRGKQLSVLLSERDDFSDFHLRGKVKVVNAPGR